MTDSINNNYNTNKETEAMAHITPETFIEIGEMPKFKLKEGCNKDAPAQILMMHFLEMNGITMEAYAKYAMTLEDDDAMEDGDEHAENLGMNDNQLPIFGPIVDDDTAEFFAFFGMKNFTSPSQVSERLAGMSGDIELLINSPGGSVFACSAICKALSEYDGGDISGTITGIAASAATVIMLMTTPGKLSIFDMAGIMIHRAQGGMRGNGPQIVSYGEYVNDIDDLMAEKYSDRGNKSKEEFAEMMVAETWMTAKKALKNGLVDNVIKSTGKKKSEKSDASASINKNNMNEEKLQVIHTESFAGFMDFLNEE